MAMAWAWALGPGCLRVVELDAVWSQLHEGAVCGDASALQRLSCARLRKNRHRSVELSGSPEGLG